MSETKLLIHATWATSNQKVRLITEYRKEIYQHIIENAMSRSIEISEITALTDHMHVLIKMHATQNLSQVIHAIKGESSSWINKNNLTEEPFLWQEDYSAITISPAKRNLMKKYFAKHEDIHKDMTFLEEVRLILRDKWDTIGEKKPE